MPHASMRSRPSSSPMRGRGNSRSSICRGPSRTAARTFSPIALHTSVLERQAGHLRARRAPAEVAVHHAPGTRQPSGPLAVCTHSEGGKSMRRALGVLSLTLAALVAGTTTTFASALVKVSDPSPFAACTVGGGPNAVNFPSGEVEPFIATAPRSSDHLVGAWQQDRWNDGGAHGLVATVTFDGGRHFRQSALPFSECTPGGIPYERASDPGVAVDRTG